VKQNPDEKIMSSLNKYKKPIYNGKIQVVGTAQLRENTGCALSSSCMEKKKLSGNLNMRVLGATSRRW
jgi:hypothetical protein